MGYDVFLLHLCCPERAQALPGQAARTRITMTEHCAASEPAVRLLAVAAAERAAELAPQ
jgi:hypothetical protein